jgi:hypothetical protein
LGIKSLRENKEAVKLNGSAVQSMCLDCLLMGRGPAVQRPAGLIESNAIHSKSQMI